MMKIIFDILILLSFLSCLEGAKSFVIQPQTWDFKGHNIGWEVARRVYKNDELNGTHIISSDSSQSEKEPILLLNGFGVGSFHQHRLISELLEEGYDSRVIYCMDYLGQGRSWPKDCEDGFSNNEKGLIYSAGTWHEQVIQFIETVVKEVHPNKKVHLVGNSVGGYLAAYVAYYRPDLIQSVCLLNPTPVWGLNLPGWYVGLSLVSLVQCCMGDIPTFN
jgi:pimeloyl-ACP methyl ester carboxylesterase